MSMSIASANWSTAPDVRVPDKAFRPKLEKQMSPLLSIWKKSIL